LSLFYSKAMESPSFRASYATISRVPAPRTGVTVSGGDGDGPDFCATIYFVQELCLVAERTVEAVPVTEAEVGQVAEHVELGLTKGFLELVLASVESVSKLPSLFCVRVTPAPVCGPVDVFFGAT
jgi:hypothetical protein